MKEERKKWMEFKFVSYNDIYNTMGPSVVKY